MPPERLCVGNGAAPGYWSSRSAAQAAIKVLDLQYRRTADPGDVLRNSLCVVILPLPEQRVGISYHIARIARPVLAHRSGSASVIRNCNEEIVARAKRF